MGVGPSLRKGGWNASERVVDGYIFVCGRKNLEGTRSGQEDGLQTRWRGRSEKKTRQRENATVQPEEAKRSREQGKTDEGEEKTRNITAQKVTGDPVRYESRRQYYLQNHRSSQKWGEKGKKNC